MTTKKMGTKEDIQKEYKEMMHHLASVLDDFMNEGKEEKEIGFALLMFPFGDDVNGRINYISNAAREQMLVALKEFIARCEGRHIEETVTETKEVH